MRRLILLGGALILLAACSPFKEAYYVDQEFGQTSQESWDRMVINKDAPHAGQVPAGLEGVTAEEIMNVNNKTFAEKPTKGKIFEFDMGGGQ